MLDALAAKGILDDLAEPPTVIVSGTDTVEVRLARRVPHIFAKALPGGPRRRARAGDRHRPRRAALTRPCRIRARSR